MVSGSGDSDSHQAHSSVNQAILLSSQSNGVIHHWHVQSGKCIHTLKEDNDNNVFALEYSHDGKVFAAAGSDTRVYIYDEHTKQRVNIMAPRLLHLPGHANRVFTLKFHPQDHNLLLSGGWDRTIQLYDLRAGCGIGSIFGPAISGDALDVHEDLIVAASNRNKDPIQIFSLTKRQLIQNVEWDTTKKDQESGFLYGARFSKPQPDLIFTGGAGRNEIKIFENNIDGTATMRTLATITDLESPVLALDASKNGDTFAFGLQDGRIYLVNYKIDEVLGEFEGYKNSFTLSAVKEHPETYAGGASTEEEHHHFAAGHVSKHHMGGAQHSGLGEAKKEERKE